MTQRIVSEFIDSNVFVVDFGAANGKEHSKQHCEGCETNYDSGFGAEHEARGATKFRAEQQADGATSFGADSEAECGVGSETKCGADRERECGAACVIVDAGARTQDVQKAVGGRRVLGVFLTHGHYDHSVYATDYAKQFGCKVFASAAAKEYLQNPDHNYSEGKFKVDDFSDFVFLSGSGVVRFVENENGEASFFVQNAGETLNANVGLQGREQKFANEKEPHMDENNDQISGFCVQFFQLGGHSKGDMSYLIGEEIFVGDVLIGRDMGRVDLYGGNRQEMKNSLQKLVETNYRIMHSGHGADNTKQTQDKVAKLWIKFLSR